ncbi:class I adenylate-forming enzyme family protein [Neobacillus niacini]|uniref:class I adenylate-forming enzyme family protein n=1 Tax=Neobacillus niacini TaxID=86668 RepID=UPI00203C159F|nr:AMP-binding protein [Neobacillus niacini]MCM3691214.1 AMP-binding protein [Neobacillus niacini]
MNDVTGVIREIGKEEQIVVRMLEHWAEETGDKAFFYYGEDEVSNTYHEFNALTNMVGRSLQSLGLKKGDRVSVFMKNSYICSLAMFGIWKAGGVYAPINFNYKGKTLSYLINDTNPTVLMIESELLPLYYQIKENINNTQLKIVVYQPKPGDHDYNSEMESVNLINNEIAFEDLLSGDSSNLSTTLNYSDTANIIYTSGTTGMPKGVVQSHRWMYAYGFFFGKILNQEDVVYNDLPLYHVGGAFFNITRAVYAGCGVACWDKFSSSQFWERINQSQSTSAVLVGVMHSWLMNAEPSAFDNCNTLNKVHTQPLPSYHHEMAKRFGFDFIMAGFGQTESGFAICGLIQELTEENGSPSEYYRGYSREEIVNISRNLGVQVHKGTDSFNKGYLGQPGGFMEAAILNENDEECLPNEIGELAYRPLMPNLILSEYFGKQEATLKAFKNLWFHTGDSAYKDENGVYYFVDRQGSVMKVKGEKFSSFLVEDILFEHPSIEMSAAFPIPAEAGDEDEIVVYIVVKNGKQLNEKELSPWIQANMPKYMWPKYIRFVDDIPKTLTNKIQKFKLKESILKELKSIPQ